MNIKDKYEKGTIVVSAHLAVSRESSEEIQAGVRRSNGTDPSKVQTNLFSQHLRNKNRL